MDIVNAKDAKKMAIGDVITLRRKNGDVAGTVERRNFCWRACKPEGEERFYPTWIGATRWLAGRRRRQRPNTIAAEIEQERRGIESVAHLI